MVKNFLEPKIGQLQENFFLFFKRQNRPKSRKKIDQNLEGKKINGEKLSPEAFLVQSKNLSLYYKTKVTPLRK